MLQKTLTEFTPLCTSEATPQTDEFSRSVRSLVQCMGTSTNIIGWLTI